MPYRVLRWMNYCVNNSRVKSGSEIQLFLLKKEQYGWYNDYLEENEGLVYYAEPCPDIRT